MAKVGRLLKERMVDELSQRLSGKPNLLVTRINRLSATDADAFRQKLHGSHARFVMVKRRLGIRTLEGLNLSAAASLFDGSVGLVLPDDDVLSIAKLTVEFVKSHDQQLEVRGGLVDGQLLDRHRVEALAALPPKPALQAQVIFTVEAPMSDVIFTIEQLIGDLGYAVEQLAGQRQAAAPANQAGKPVAGDNQGQVSDTSAPSQQEGTPS